jgi:hypothetical protein
VLRRLAESGTTVVFTTHAIQDLARVDRVAFLARGGSLAFTGTVAEALAHFGVDEVDEVYERLAAEPAPIAPTAGPAAAAPEGGATARPQDHRPRRQPGAVRQWAVLTRRTLETLVRSRLTMAIMLGSPVMIVAMFAVLFRPGAFDFADPSPSAIVMIIFCCRRWRCCCRSWSASSCSCSRCCAGWTACPPRIWGPTRPSR